MDGPCRDVFCAKHADGVHVAAMREVTDAGAVLALKSVLFGGRVEVPTDNTVATVFRTL